MAQPRFAQAVDDYLKRETRGMRFYMDELNERSPFKE
ncbi:MAG: peptidogalycan biosysnthesis protein [Sulfuricella sp.]|nr:peptidogalycan biosysnthesis protein [Sulfuricella sp.]